MLLFSEIYRKLRKKIPTLTEQGATSLIKNEFEDIITDLLVARYWENVAKSNIEKKFPAQLKPKEQVPKVISGTIAALHQWQKAQEQALKEQAPSGFINAVDWEQVNTAIERDVQLHEDFRVYYIVDGYRAEYSPDDGNTVSASAEASTPLLAIAKLFGSGILNKRGRQ